MSDAASVNTSPDPDSTNASVTDKTLKSHKPFSNRLSERNIHHSSNKKALAGRIFKDLTMRLRMPCIQLPGGSPVFSSAGVYHVWH
ncbi:MAG: hypothetical protein IJ354_10975 [Clostridia bacterium]|nr:hypothetical protein [Clostridia bacterium]